MKNKPFLTLRERLLISRREKVAKFRRKNHLRKDGWIEPENRMTVAEKLCKYRIRRIELPKFGAPVSLSLADKDDALQAGLMACVETGFFEHGLVTRDVTKAIRRAMESRDCLRRDCIREIGTSSPELVAAAVGFTTEEETISHRLTNGQKEAFRALMADLRTARKIDASRKADSAFRGHRDFLLETLGHLTGRTARSRSGNSFAKRAQRFTDYVKTGWRENSRTGHPQRVNRNLARELDHAWNQNFVSA